jgi:hypothetical protein
VTVKATFGAHDVGGGGMSGRQSGASEEACPGLRALGRSQSPHSTEAAMSCERTEKQNPFEGRWGRKVDA